MKNGATDSERWRARAALWELLALSFRYPGDELAGAVGSGEWAAAAREIAEVLGLVTSLPDAPAAGAAGPGKPPAGEAGRGPEGRGGIGGLEGPADPEALLHALRAEATRLFVGAPDPAASPYEGVWRAADDGVQALLFVNPHSMEAERFMRACGLGRPEGTNEPLDHVATECELMQYLASLEAGVAAPPAGAPAGGGLPGGSPAAAYGAFLEGHARAWMPRFAEAVASESREPFYRAAAQLLGSFLR